MLPSPPELDGSIDVEDEVFVDKLNDKVIGPLVAQSLLFEFRVIAATPPSFVADSSTMIIFEVVVPCPWPIKDSDMRRWEQGIGPDVRLLLAPAQSTRSSGSWDARRAKSVLTRAMVLHPPNKKEPARAIVRKRPTHDPASWLAACVDRSGRVRKKEEEEAKTSNLLAVTPSLFAVEESSGRRFEVQQGSTLLSAQMASVLAQSLPIRFRWRTAWRLAYSPRLHGVSLQTFYRIMDQEGPSLLLIQDHVGHVFGGFGTTTWRRAERYFGTGESFVFKFLPKLPKPVLPLSEQIRHMSGQTGPPGTDEEAAKHVVKHALNALGGWHDRVQASALNGQKAALEAGMVTSPTEALDEVLQRLGEGAEKEQPQSNHRERAAPTSADDVRADAAATAAAAESGGGGQEEAPAVSKIAQQQLPTATDDGDDGDQRSTLPDEHDHAHDRDDDGALDLDDSDDGNGDVGGDEPVVDPNSIATSDIKVFHWSSTDPYFQFSDSECIAFGGGTSFALYVEKDLLHGMSGPSSTFASEPLSSAQHFVIGDLECWVFDDPSAEAMKPLR